MPGDFRAVAPLSIDRIERFAEELRVVFGIGAQKSVRMISLIECVLPEILEDYVFCVLPEDEMPGMAGLTSVGGEPTIYIEEQTYIALCNNDPDARVVAAHEFGHLVLHSHQVPSFAKRTRNDDRVDPEWQADRFAEAWLMPWSGVARCRSARHVAAKYGVPDEIAARRFRDVKFGEEIQGELF